MQYYVVKNKETGMYFRGKGANMWGKYYNQASIYRFRKHAENAVEERAYRGEQAEVVEIQITEGAVTDTNVGCKWIPCSERLPKQGEQVICTLVSARGHRFVTQEQFFTNLLKEPFPMVAWMPLPEPYREDGV